MAVCSVLSDSVNPWNVASHAPLLMEFCRQEYCSGLPFVLRQTTNLKPPVLDVFHQSVSYMYIFIQGSMMIM